MALTEAEYAELKKDLNNHLEWVMPDLGLLSGMIEELGNAEVILMFAEAMVQMEKVESKINEVI